MPSVSSVGTACTTRSRASSVASSSSGDIAPGDHAKAVSLLDEALSMSTELGMPPLMQRAVALKERAESLPAKAPKYPEGLTPREVEVLRLVADGRINQEIADKLFITLNTVIRHVSNIFFKISSSDRAEAVVHASQNDLL